ncbi:uncharacterized protein LOC141614035 [Silene latifolia]|uniref:uncharacterized protein LOC141614035 n=1 Tax=Silene latifolia TaxID=37657 RepID=UPI003D77DEB7
MVILARITKGYHLLPKSVKVGQRVPKRTGITIKLFKSTPRNPQSNGQAESSNKIVMNNLKRRLEEIGANWADKLPFVLWSDRTTPKVVTGQTPLSLVYGVEAVIPSEVQIPTHRYDNSTEERNQVEMASSLDTIDEPRISAQLRMAAYK